jgi:hypothetical protein
VLSAGENLQESRLLLWSRWGYAVVMLAALTVSLSACLKPISPARREASRRLQCPLRYVKVQKQAAGMWLERGCGFEALCRYDQGKSQVVCQKTARSDALRAKWRFRHCRRGRQLNLPMCR